MASELRVNTLKDASGNNSIATSFVAGGSAKAWVNFNGIGTVAVRDSLNASSIQDNGTGYYSLNFSSSTANINYSVSGGTNGSNNSFPSAATASGNIRFNTNTGSPYKAQPTTSAFTMTITQDQSLATAVDVEWANANIHGDLA